MKKYDNKETAPLIYHSIYLYIVLPLSFIANIFASISSFNFLNSQPELFAYGLLDLIFEVALVVLSGITFWGLRKWKPYSWYTIHISNIGIFLYNMCVIGIYFIYGYFSFYDITEQLANIFVAILVSIYYWKRKGIFFSPKTTASEPEKPITEETPNEWDRIFDEDSDSNTENESNDFSAFSEDKKENENTQTAAYQEKTPQINTTQPKKKDESAENKKMRTIFLILVLIGCFAASIYFYTENTALEKEIKHLEFLLSQAEYREKDKIETIKQYKNRIDSMSDEYEFYHKYAVIVTETGYRYHRYGCQHIEGRSFWIYNIAAAKGEGYTPCLDCNPPQ